METLTIFGYVIQTYGLFAVIGFLCCLAFIYYHVKKSHLPPDDAIHLIVYACLGAGIGGKLFYLIQHIDAFVFFSNSEGILILFLYNGTNVFMICLF